VEEEKKRATPEVSATLYEKVIIFLLFFEILRKHFEIIKLSIGD